MDETKRALRSRLIAVRAGLAPEDRAAKARAIAERAAALPSLGAARVVALYAPLGAEVDPSTLAARLRARGAEVIYPRAVRGERRLSFAAADPASLLPGPFGALEPPADAPETPLEAVDCVVLPGVAFSEDGRRLGRGGGHYDATLGLAARATRVALAFEVQLVPTLPSEPHDATMDAIVTELRTLLFDRRGAAAPGGTA